MKHQTARLSIRKIGRVWKYFRVIDPAEPYRAEKLLLEMDHREAVARQWAAARTGILRETFAEIYRVTIGVDPADREALRAGLEAIRDGRTQGEVTVAGVLHRVRTQA